MDARVHAGLEVPQGVELGAFARCPVWALTPNGGVAGEQAQGLLLHPLDVRGRPATRRSSGSARLHPDQAQRPAPAHPQRLQHRLAAAARRQRRRSPAPRRRAPPTAAGRGAASQPRVDAAAPARSRAGAEPLRTRAVHQRLAGRADPARRARRGRARRPARRAGASSASASSSTAGEQHPGRAQPATARARRRPAAGRSARRPRPAARPGRVG